MLIRLLKYLRGYVKLRVEGYAPERFLNLCNAHGILLWGVETIGASYELYVSVRDYRKMRPFVKKTGTRLILLKKQGLPFFLHRFRKRKLFFAGLLLCILGIYLLSLFVWNIHLEGNVTQSNEEVLEYLQTIGITHGMQKKKVVCEQIETGLRRKFPNMLWVSAEMRGTRILIRIRENTDQDIIADPQIKEETAESIVTEYAGTIASMIVRQGTSVVKAGDLVEAGQTLVEGYYTVKNDAGEVVRYEGVSADADIFLTVTENYQDRFLISYQKKEPTGKRRFGICLKIMEWEIELLPKVSFEKYEKTENVQEFHITENFYLPFSFTRIWYTEYMEKTQNYTEKELNALAKTRYLEKYENILQKGVQIIEKNVKIDTNGKLCTVAGYVTLRIPVTKKVPAIIPELRPESSGEGE